MGLEVPGALGLPVTGPPNLVPIVAAEGQRERVGQGWVSLGPEKMGKCVARRVGAPLGEPLPKAPSPSSRNYGTPSARSLLGI